MTDTATKEGRQKRLEELAAHYKETRSTAGLVRTIGGSAADFDERFENSGSHPDEGMDNSDL